jgi:hypothetical protein
VVAYHYCDYATEATLLTSNILGTLLRQLLRNTNIGDDIDASIDKLYDDGARSPPSSELADLLETVSRRFKATHLVLDGIDECDNDNVDELLGIITRLSSSDKSCIKIIVASRDESSIVKALKGRACVSLAEGRHEEDIKNFVTEQVALRRSLGDLHIKNPKLEDLVISQLVSKSGGMYAICIC